MSVESLDHCTKLDTRQGIKNYVSYMWNNFLSTVSQATRFYAYGNPQNDANTFRHFSVPVARSLLKKHTVLMLFTSGGTCTIEVRYNYPEAANPNSIVVIPSGVLTEVSANDIDAIVTNENPLVVRMTYSITPSSNLQTFNSTIFFEVLEK